MALLLLLTLLSGLPLRIWRRTLPALLGLALLVGLLTAALPVGTTLRASLQRPPDELRLEPSAATAAGAQAPAAERAGLSWELLRWGPLQLEIGRAHV